jgi:thiol-disulfide isomerase/thioredoxin
MLRQNWLAPCLITLFTLTWSVRGADAPEATLKIGDAAPALQLDKWLKGEPVKELEKGKVYVIECWATWCGPCIASMPHVTKMQAKYKDKGVVVLGVNVWERDASAPEPFVKKMGDKMGYRVVMDDTSDGMEKGRMALTWLKAAGRNGIPCSFLIDRQGKIAWIGHPLSMERPLAALADDKFDAAEQAKFEKKVEGLSEELMAARRAKDDDKALATIDQLITLDPGMGMYYGMNKLSILMQKKDYAAANALAAALAEDNIKEGGSESMLASLVFTLLNAPDQSKIDTALALKLATKVYEANKDGWQYQTLLARAYAANKQYDKAAEVQAEALAKVPAQIKAREEKTLADYKEKAQKKEN